MRFRTQGEQKMRRFVYLFELDSVRNSKKEIQRGQQALFEEIVKISQKDISGEVWQQEKSICISIRRIRIVRENAV